MTLVNSLGAPSDVATANLTVNHDKAVLVGTGSTLRVKDLTLGGAFNGSLFDDGSAGTLVANQFILEENAVLKGSTTDTPVLRVTDTGVIKGEYTIGAENVTFERSLQIDSTGALHTNNYDREIIMGSTSSNSAPYVTVNGGTITTNNGSLTFTNKAASLGTLSFRQSDSTISGKVLATGFRTEVNGNLNFDGSGTLESAVYQQTGGAITGANGLIRTTDATQTSTISGPGTVFNTNANFAGNVEFTNGATLKGGMRTITGSNAKTMLVDDTSLIDLSTSDLEVRGFKSLILDGALRVGHDNVDANRLILSNSTQLQGSVSRALELDSSFNQYYYGKDFSGTDVVVQGGTSQSWQQEDWTISNAFGKFDFGYRNGNYALVKFETSNLNDVDEVRENLNRNWDGNVVSRGFAQTIAEVAKTSIGVANGAAVVPTNNPYYEAGLVNRDILEAFAHGHSTFSTDSDTDVSGSLDRAMLAMYNDSNQTGVVQVSVDVSRDIVNTLHSRLDAFRRYLVAIDPATGSEVALGNTILHDDRYFNRVWAGVLGSRMNADKRKGFEGYKYKGEGGIIGYDRGFGAALLGFSAAYIQGDYEDKSAIAHDSDIENYAFDVYGTYNFSNGFYTTVNAGYTRSRNKINELRGNNWAREKYHTDSWRAGLKIGYDIMVSDTFFVSPSLGVDAYYARSNRHHASIDDIFLVEYGRMKTHGVEIPFDVKLSKDIVINNCSTVTLMANGGYAYNLHDKGIRGDLRVNGLRGANVGPYKAEGRKLGHHSWNAGAGVRFRYNEWEFAAKYDFHGRKGYTDHRLMGQIGFNF